MSLRVVFQVQVVVVVRTRAGASLVRTKREWVIPPKTLIENKDYTNEEYVARVS